MRISPVSDADEENDESLTVSVCQLISHVLSRPLAAHEPIANERVLTVCPCVPMRKQRQANPTVDTITDEQQQAEQYDSASMDIAQALGSPSEQYLESTGRAMDDLGRKLTRVLGERRCFHRASEGGTVRDLELLSRRQ